MEKDPGSSWIKTDPLLRKIRGDLRYAALLLELLPHGLAQCVPPRSRELLSDPMPDGPVPGLVFAELESWVGEGADPSMAIRQLRRTRSPVGRTRLLVLVRSGLPRSCS